MEKLKTINIKGKEYVEVNTRIKAFYELYKDWTITTEVLNYENDSILMRATIKDNFDRVRATGTAMEEKTGASMVNKTSYVENCETSAIGRALGILGIGIDTSIASAEEVDNAIKQQEKISPKKVSTKELTEEEKKNKYIEFLNNYSVDKFNAESEDKKEKIIKMVQIINDVPFASESDVIAYLKNNK